MARLPEGFMRALDSEGDAAPGALVYVYAAGTTTPVATFSDKALSIANTHPVVADASGAFGDVYVGELAYKVRLTNAAGVELPGSPTDNVNFSTLYDPDIVEITGGTINGTAIGGTTAAAGAFTTASASSAPTDDAHLTRKDYVDDAAAAIADGAVTTAKIADTATTNAKLSDMSQDTIKGRTSGAGTGVPVDLAPAAVRAIVEPASNGMLAKTSAGTWGSRTLTAGTGISITNGDGVSGNPTIVATGTAEASLTDGQVTTAKLADNAVTTAKIADEAITNAKLADMAEATIKGRAAGAGTGVPVDLTAAQGRTALGLGTIATQGAGAVAVTGGTIEATAIGGTTAAAGSFTTASASSAPTDAAHLTRKDYVDASVSTYFIVQETQDAGTSGGTFTQDAWRTRALNTTQVNTISGASLASNQVTLPAGTYRVTAGSICHRVDGNASRLYNITASATLLIGESGYAYRSYGMQSYGKVMGIFTLSSTTVIELQHYCEATRETNGFGNPADTGERELYAHLEIEKFS